jgi:hypothetical protein
MLNLIINQASNENIYKEFLETSRNDLRRCSKGILRSFNNIIYFVQKYRKASPSQTTLAYLAGLSRGHENRCLQFLESKGYIKKTYRHLSSCIYEVNPLFFHPAIAHSLKYILPNLMLGLTLTLAFSSAAAFEKNVTQIKVKPSPLVIYNLGAKRKVGNNQGQATEIVMRARVRTRRPLSCQLQNGWSDFFKKRINGEKVNIEFLPALENFKSLALTKKGKSALMAYIDEVIAWSDEVMIRRGTKENSYDYLIRLCEIKSRMLGVKPDYSLSRKLLAHFNFPDSEPFVLSNKVNQAIAKKPANYQTKSSNSLKRDAKVKRPTEWEPADRKFMPGCQRTNHHSSIKKFNEILRDMPFNLDYQRRASLLGGEDYIKAAIFRNEECLKDNHLESDQNE